MQTATGFASALFRAGTNVIQVFNHNHGTDRNGIDDTPTDDVVAIAAEAVNLPGQTTQMSLGRASAFRLKRTLQSEISTVNVFPTAFPKELGI
nr:hypothetical protein [Alicyclobacillus shizuokensis]